MSGHRVVVYTQEYPTANDPHDGLFTQALVDALEPRLPTTVICPVPWFPMPDFLLRRTGWVSTRGLPHHERRGGMDVFFPRIPLVPVLTRGVQPQIQALRVSGPLRRLRAAGRLTLLNAHSIYPDGIAAARLARSLRIPLVLTAIGSDINANLDSPKKLGQIRAAMESAVAVIGVSRALCETMRAIARRARIEHVPNGIDRRRFSLGGSEPALAPELQGDARPVLLFVGRLHPVKGLDVLLEALATLRDSGPLEFQTVIIGDGPEHAELTRRCAELRLQPDVRFIGGRPHHEVAIWLRRAKVFCLPSRNEGMPNVVLEAQASGVPVVATRVGGLAELVGQRSGILVASGDSAELAAALSRAMNSTWNAADVAAQVSWADWQKSADRYLEIFDSITPVAA
jgi:glycosyltransferase involved in cell wall biosynthesis